MMQNLEQFLRLLTGHFDNREQFNQMQKAEKAYPLAEHVNTVCNDKIRNLPADFRGKFLVEESYYETNGKKHASAHLFLFTEEQDGVMLLKLAGEGTGEKHLYNPQTIHLLQRPV